MNFNQSEVMSLLIHLNNRKVGACILNEIICDNITNNSIIPHSLSDCKTHCLYECDVISDAVLVFNLLRSMGHTVYILHCDEEIEIYYVSCNLPFCCH